MNAVEIVRARIDTLKCEISAKETRIAECKRELDQLMDECQAAMYGIRELSEIADQLAPGSAGTAKHEPPNGKAARSRNPNKPAALVLSSLGRSTEGLTASELWEVIKDKVNSKANKPRNIIGTTLYNLKKRGMIVHHEDTGKYTIK